MNYEKACKYDPHFIKENIMGPNPMKLLEELLAAYPIRQGSTVLDLGCGRGVTSIFMAKDYGLRVFATDLWITATENKKRFDSMGLTQEQIVPIHAEAHDLPYAEEFFDAAVCVDSYHYFGCDETYLGTHLLPLVKHGGSLLFIVPGFKKEFPGDLPPELLLSWTKEDLGTLLDCSHWKAILQKTPGVEICSIYEMEGFQDCWDDWLACENEYAIGDRKSMEAGAWRYMNIIAMVLRKK